MAAHDVGRELLKELSRLREKHLIELYRSGFLDRSAFDEANSLLSTFPHIVRVKSMERFVAAFTSSTLPNMDPRTPIDILIAEGCFQIKRHDCEFITLTKYKLNKSFFIDVCDHLNLIIHNTLIWRSIQKEKLNAYTSMLQQQLAETSELNVDRLAAFIQENLAVNVSLVEARTALENYKSGRLVLRARRRADGALSKRRPIFILRKFVRKRFLDRGPQLSHPLHVFSSEALAGGKLIEVQRGTPLTARRVCSCTLLLFPLCRSTEPTSLRKQIFMVHRARRAISEWEIILIQEIISFYFDHLVRYRQQRQLTTTANSIREVYHYSDDSMEALDSFLLSCLRQILTELNWTTQSFRTSYWRYDARYNALSPLYIVGYRDGKIQEFERLAINSIPVRNSRTSSIVSTFVNATVVREPLHIGDTRRPVKYIENRRLDDIIAPYDLTQSEIMVPIYQAQTPVGVLYGESRLLDAFSGQEWFFAAMGSLVSELITAVDRRRDAALVSDKLSTLDAFHELSPNIEILLRHSPVDVREKFRALFEIADTDGETSKFRPGSLTAIREINFSLLFGEILSDFGFNSSATMEAVKRGIKIRRSVEVIKTTEYEYSAYRFIFKNLISNAFKNQPAGYRTVIAITFSKPELGFGIRSPAYEEGRNDVFGLVQVHVSITPALDPQIIHQMGRASVSRPKSAPRRGMQLVGLVARQLGGTFEAFSSIDRRKTRLLIQIPLRRNN
jgi:hypothetical protein